MDREADTGGILSQTMETLGGAGRAVALYVIVLGVYGGLGGLLGLAAADGSIFSVNWSDGEWLTSSDYADGVSAALASLFSFGNVVLYVIASYLLLRQLLIGTGRQIAPGSRFWTYLLMSILAMLGMMVGFVLLIVPGLIVLVRWSAANGMAISRGSGVTDSLGDSWEATSGHGISIFLAGLVLSIAMAILASAIALPFAAMAVQGEEIGFGSISVATGLAVALQSFIDALSNAVLLALSVAVFHLVSPADEGVAEVFE